MRYNRVHRTCSNATLFLFGRGRLVRLGHWAEPCRGYGSVAQERQLSDLFGPTQAAMAQANSRSVIIGQLKLKR